MFISIFANSGLTAKKLLTYLFLLFFVAGCDSVETTESSRSQQTPEPKNPQVTLNSSLDAVAMNGSVMLTWDGTNVSSCISSDNWSGSNAIKGSRMIENLTSDQNFSLSCSGVGGTANAEISVTVDGVAVPTVTVSASPVNLAYSGTTDLSWDSTNATSCVASGDWSGNRSTSGSTSFANLVSGKTYSLTCSGPGGNASDSVSVTVAGPAAASLNLSASPSSLPFNGSTTLSWNSGNTNSCTASGDWSGSKVTSGSQVIMALTADSVFSLSCSGPGGTVNRTVNVTVAAPAPTMSLSANPGSIAHNGSTTLSWSSTDATGCVASGDWSGNKAASGSQAINRLTIDSQFGLTCSGAGGSVNDTVSVTVAAPPPVPTLSLSANPGSVAQNGSTTLSWNSTDATSCVASGDWSGSKGTAGPEVISGLMTDSQFTLTCSGAGGSASDTVSVTVAAPAPTLSLSANPGSVAQNGSTTLDWSSTDATSCVASGDWSGNKGTAGPEVIIGLMTDSQFTLTCSGAGGSVSDTVSVTVAAPAPTLSFSASPGSVAQNGSTTLSWNSTDATSCVASGDWSGSKATSGSESTAALTIDSQYTLTCSGAGGSVNDAVTVTVVLSNNGTALLTWTPPTENTNGSTLTDLAGYKIRYGTSPGNYNHTEVINDPGLTSFLIENLASADWYFVITAFNSSDVESAYSIEVSKTIN